MEFLYPNVFYMLLIPLILLIVLILTNKSGMEQHFSKELLDKLSVNKNSLGKTTRNILLFISLILFVIALGRPVMDKKELDLKQKLIPIVIALDLSKSMYATDIYPNRISLAKKKLKEIITYAKNTTIGVVLFAKDSYILSPVTEDFLSLNYIVDNLDTNIDVANGSNIAAVMEATNHMLSDFSVKNLIILSDGGNEKEYEEELEFAKENSISVYSIGLATKQGSPIPVKDGYLTDKKGKIVSVKLNDSIKNLSLKSKGGYIDFTLDNSDIKAIIDRINLQSKKEELKSAKYKTYKELFYYPLGLAIFIFLIATSSLPRKNTAVAALLVCFYFLPNNTYAFEFEFETIKKAKEYYEKKEYEKASDEYRKLGDSSFNYYNLANSLYKQGKYKDALNIYEKIVTNDNELEYKKLHNMGNSFVKTNDLNKAKEFYEKALHIKDDKQTKENLELVKKELEKQKQQKQQNQDNKQQNKNDKNNKKNKDNQQNKDQKKNDQNNSDNQQNKQKENKDSKKDKKEQNKQDSKNKQNKEKENKENKNKNQKEQTKGSQINKQNQKKQEISDMEEKKWMKILNNKKTPVYLQKMETSKGNGDEIQPW